MRLEKNWIQTRLIEAISAIHSKIVSGDRQEAENVFLGYGVRMVTQFGQTTQQKVAKKDKLPIDLVKKVHTR